MITFIYTIIIIAMASAHILGKINGHELCDRIFKALTTTVIMSYVVFFAPEHLYTKIILLGLIFSLLGDICLMSDRYFNTGIYAFLITHVFYIIGFSLLVEKLIPFVLLLSVIFPLFTFILFHQFLPKSQKQHVLLYSFVIGIMGCMSLHMLFFPLSGQTFLVLVGGLLFISSDLLLSWDRFRSTYKKAPIFIMSTYYGAQWLIALSTLGSSLVRPF